MVEGRGHIVAAARLQLDHIISVKNTMLESDVHLLGLLNVSVTYIMLYSRQSCANCKFRATVYKQAVKPVFMPRP